ncbi:UDP-glucose 4-epimerase GalE [Hyalangium versicolor]|uniref:UDP-glucose 4-epimerase GalE n=1 Tax=Hyalangium versicolor TaxID=2861190 RepID=UPI001CCE6DFF|nr:UDP-glucose 4-epimerase GalE [Hyalangium versicolor]
MRVMVTGGAGYIGSVVTEELLRGGDDVVVYDSLYKGHREAVVEGAAFVKGDLLDTALLRETFAQHRVEAVVHMAADSLVGESVKEPAKYYRNNVLGGLSLLDAMRGSGVSSLVFSSTAAVYGEPAKQPIEETDPTQPTNPYGETKLAFERALRWYEGAYGLKFVSLRYFNAAGATERSGERHDPETHLIPLVLQAAAGQRPEITVFGDDYPTPDGTCVRDYVHVVDLAQAHVLALHALAKGHPSSIYNLGCGGEGYSVKQVIDCARRVTGREIPVRLGARRPGDPAVLIASSARIMRELNWRPQQQKLEAIVESAWSWMQRRRSNP